MQPSPSSGALTGSLCSVAKNVPSYEPTGFFSLPFELRTEIYIHAFRRGVIHIHGPEWPEREPEWVQIYTGPKPLNYSLEHPLKTDYHAWQVDARIVRYTYSPIYGHAAGCVSRAADHTPGSGCLCVMRLGRRKGDPAVHTPGPDCPYRLPTAALCTSRQFNVEARKLLWSTNTFQFWDCKTFANFIVAIGPENRANLRSLSLTIAWVHMCGGDDGGCVLSLTSPFVETLHGLRDLNLTIGQFEARRSKLQLGYKAQIDLFSAFAKLPLKNVDVSLKRLYGHGLNNLGVQRTCLEPDRLNFANRIKNKLLENDADRSARYLAEQLRAERCRYEGQNFRLKRSECQVASFEDLSETFLEVL